MAKVYRGQETRFTIRIGANARSDPARILFERAFFEFSPAGLGPPETSQQAQPGSGSNGATVVRPRNIATLAHPGLNAVTFSGDA